MATKGSKETYAATCTSARLLSNTLIVILAARIGKEAIAVTPPKWVEVARALGSGAAGVGVKYIRCVFT